jgi:hypothetical protein
MRTYELTAYHQRSAGAANFSCIILPWYRAARSSHGVTRADSEGKHHRGRPHRATRAGGSPFAERWLPVPCMLDLP